MFEDITLNIIANIISSVILSLGATIVANRKLQDVMISVGRGLAIGLAVIY
jgi:hypothetical protein